MQAVAVARRAMATRFEILLYGDDEIRLRAAGEQALDEVERLESHLSLYRETSDISRVNERAFIEPVRLEHSLFRLLQHAQQLWWETGGAFDITIAPLVRCWGFMGGTGAMPAAEEIAEARARVGMEHVVLREENWTIRFLREGMMLDLGAVGKGYAVESAAEILKEAGVTRALIHGGTSTVQAIGAPPGAEAWAVAVQSPDAETVTAQTLSRFDASSRNPLEFVLAVVPMKDQAMSVSAVHGRSFNADGKTFGHVIDPRSGVPVQGALLALVVLPSATETDALSTALLTMGPGGHDQIANLRDGMQTLLAIRSATSPSLVLKSKGIVLRQKSPSNVRPILAQYVPQSGTLQKEKRRS